MCFVFIFLFVVGCTPKVVGIRQLPEGNDMLTLIKNGAISYNKEDVPAVVLTGTGRYIMNFSATLKVTDITNTRMLIGETTSLIASTGGTPHSMSIVFYLCQPLLVKADKLSNGTIVYGGTGYPKLIAGQTYVISGILQPNWQGNPLVYVVSGYNIKEATKNEAFFYAPEEQFKQEATSLAAEQTIKAFLGYWNTKNLTEMEKLLAAKKQGVDWELARTDYVKLINISEFYTEETNTKTFVAVFDFKYKKAMGGAMHGGITYWNFILKRDKENSPWLIQDWGGGGNTY